MRQIFAWMMVLVLAMIGYQIYRSVVSDDRVGATDARYHRK